jgi:hypothetical protein
VRCSWAVGLYSSWNSHGPAPFLHPMPSDDTCDCVLPAQVWNHTFFWESMKPNGGGEPSGKLADAINAAFGSLDEFKTQFKNAGGSKLRTLYYGMHEDAPPPTPRVRSQGLAPGHRGV